MTDLVTLVVVGLLVAGVIASIVPVVPGALLTLAGLIGYVALVGTGEIWWVWLVLLIGFAALAAVFDVVATAVAANRGGASTRTATIGLLVGVLLIVPLGPLGLLVGIAGTVFVTEHQRGRTRKESARAAAYATVGVLASKVVQLLVNLAVLVAFVILLLV